jgi:transcriptional regulator GlxA family with amidase domain
MDPRQRIAAYIYDCLRRESPPRVSELAELLCVSRVTLNQRIKRIYGVSAAAYLKTAQLAHAKHLLQATTLTTANIAYACAFGTRRTFYRSFRRSLGTTPATFRRQARGR